MNLHLKLVHAATEYDRKQSKKRGYNIYALAHYMGRIQDIEKDIAAGRPLRQALLAGFTGRLLDALLKAAGEPRSTKEEIQNGPWAYKPEGKEVITEIKP